MTGFIEHSCDTADTMLWIIWTWFRLQLWKIWRIQIFTICTSISKTSNWPMTNTYWIHLDNSCSVLWRTKKAFQLETSGEETSGEETAGEHTYRSKPWWCNWKDLYKEHISRTPPPFGCWRWICSIKNAKKYTMFFPNFKNLFLNFNWS